jgi:anti-sigma factor RsiW
MECREVRDLLDSFIGQELMVETNHELMRHLESCPECRAELDARRQMRSTLRGAFANTPTLAPAPGFTADVLARVRDGRTPSTTRTQISIFPTSVKWGAIAASALLAVAAGVWMYGNRVSGLVRDAVGDHRNCAVKFALTERPIPLADAAARFDPIYARLEDTPPNGFLTPVGPAEVVDRHSCVFAGRRFGHVVLRLDAHLVSVLVTGDERIGTGVSAANATDLPDVDGQHVASFATPGHSVFVVGDLPDAEFRSVAQSLAQPLVARLAWLWNIPATFGD